MTNKMKQTTDIELNNKFEPQTIKKIETMKTNLNILAGAATILVLASCNKKEVVSIPEPDAISFHTQVGLATKAASKTAFTAGDKFNVWASYDNAGAVTRYFQDNFKFDGSYWYSDTTPYYWPADIDATHTLTFHAVWPETIGRPVAADAFSYAVGDAAESQKDVLYAKHVSTTRETSGVSLNFRHALSQIVVKAKNTSGTLKCEVTGIKIAYVNKAGDFKAESMAASSTDEHDNGNLARSDWKTTDGAASAARAYIQNGMAINVTPNAAAAQLGEPWILIPQLQAKAGNYTSDGEGAAMDGAYLAVKMTIKNAADGTVVASERWCSWPVALNWTPGYKYTYIIDLAGGGYEEKNDDGDEDLDPVLENQEIFFVDCTVDAWDVSDQNITL